MASFIFILNVADLGTEALLAKQFVETNHYYAAMGLFIVYMLNSLTHILFDWLNQGRCRYLLADLLQLRFLIEYFNYIGKWWQKRHRYWHEHSYRSNLSFESFFSNMPSLMIQTYVIMYDPAPATWTQVHTSPHSPPHSLVCIVLCSNSAFCRQ